MATKPLVLPILKFSYTTTSAERTSPLAWTHMSGGGDLAVVLDSLTVMDDGSAQNRKVQYMKVQKGIEVLEELNLAWLVQEAQATAAQQSPRNLRSSVAVLVKTPCLAIRYPKQMNQVRRFQVKFASEADYYKAVSILSEIGCPITDSAATAGPPLASSGLMESNTPSTTSGTHPLYAISDVPTIRPSSALPDTRPSSLGSSSTISAVTGGSCSNDSANRNIAPPPTTTTFARSGSHPHSTNLNPNLALKHRPSTAPSFPDVETLSQLLPPKRELPFAKRGRQQQQQQRRENARGKKTAALISDPATPSRKLSSTSTVSRLHVSSASVSSFPAGPPAFSQLVAHQTPSSYQTGQPVTLDPFISHNQSQTQSPSDRSENQATAPPPSSAPPALFEPSHPQRPLQTPFPVPSTSCAAASLASSSYSAVQAHWGLPEFLSQVDASTTAPVPVPVTAPPTTTSTTTAARVAGPASSSTSILDLSSTDLSSYLSTPTPERAARLESWVCAQLENDGFLALCQDVEGIWRRVAYGM
ncbi:hypothetical protein VTO42DRAFT_8294 [Malbranchea cinnamomea]